MTDKKFVRSSEFAEMMGVSAPAVSRWKSQKRVVMKGKLVDVEATKELLANVRKGGAEKVNKKINQVNSPESAVKFPQDPVNFSAARDPIEMLPGEQFEQAAVRALIERGADMSFDEARRVKENYLALLNELEYDQKSGVVVLVEDVVRYIGSEFANLRTRLRAIGPNYGPQLSRLNTPAEASAFISEAIDEALYELAADNPNMRWNLPSGPGLQHRGMTTPAAADHEAQSPWSKHDL